MPKKLWWRFYRSNNSRLAGSHCANTDRYWVQIFGRLMWLRDQGVMIFDDFKRWWDAERVGRVEEDTSQDFCPTNGEAVIWRCVCSLPLIGVLILIMTSR